MDDVVGALRPESVSGRINVGCFRTLTPFYLPLIIRDLSDDYPELYVDVTELSAERVSEALLNRAIEVALTYNLGLGPEIHREVLATVPLYAAVSQSHPGPSGPL